MEQIIGVAVVIGVLWAAIQISGKKQPPAERRKTDPGKPARSLLQIAADDAVAQFNSHTHRFVAGGQETIVDFSSMAALVVFKERGRDDVSLVIDIRRDDPGWWWYRFGPATVGDAYEQMQQPQTPAAQQWIKAHVALAGDAWRKIDDPSIGSPLEEAYRAWRSRT